MEQVLIFDVDGTLTGPRRVMPEDFARFFNCVVKSMPVFLVSGSDYPKLAEQLPRSILSDVAGVFCCSGNEFWQGGEIVRRNETDFPSAMLDLAQELIEASSFEPKTGRHIERRTGSVNLSVVGRNANRAERALYEVHDSKNHERQMIMRELEAAFPEFEVNRGGQISVDVSPRGWNKAQVYNEIAALHPDHGVHFFGDNICEGGNDLPLARAVATAKPDNVVHAVRDHFETWKMLQDMFCQKRSDVA